MTVLEKVSKLKDVCGKWAFVARKVDGENVSVVSAAIRCHSWFCPRCAGRKARKFAQAALAYFEGERLSFFTVTAPPTDTPRTSVRDFAGRWNILRTEITRHVKGFKYVRVIERQPGTGRAHYHLIINRYIPHQILKKAVKNAGFGKIYDIRSISSTDAFYYVLKYLRKPLVDSEYSQSIIDFNARLISGSRGFKLVAAARKGWEVIVNIATHAQAIKRVKQYIWTLIKANVSFISFKSSPDSDLFIFQLPDYLRRCSDDIVQYFIERNMETFELNPWNADDDSSFFSFLNRLQLQPQLSQ